MTDIDTEMVREYWAVAPGIGEIRRTRLAPLPNAADDASWIELRTIYSAISRGTETLVARGRVPTSEFERMRSPWQAGDFPFPVKYGYCAVSRVERGPAELVGRHVFSLSPHQDRARLPLAAVHLLPDDLPPARAVLCANMETALNAVWDGESSLCDRVIVLGAGVVGLLTASLLAQIPGTEVQIVDPQPARAVPARCLGLQFAAPCQTMSDADLVINASGDGAALAQALALAGPEATVLELSWLGDQPATLPLGGAFHSRRLTIKSSQVGQLPPRRRPRWSHARRLHKAMALLASDDRLDELVSHEIAFEELPQTMAKLCQGWHEPLAIRVRYDPARE